MLPAPRSIFWLRLLAVWFKVLISSGNKTTFSPLYWIAKEGFGAAWRVKALASITNVFCKDREIYFFIEYLWGNQEEKTATFLEWQAIHLDFGEMIWMLWAYTHMANIISSCRNCCQGLCFFFLPWDTCWRCGYFPRGSTARLFSLGNEELRKIALVSPHTKMDLPPYHYLRQVILQQSWLSSTARLKLSCSSCTLKDFCASLPEEAGREGRARHPSWASHGEMWGSTPSIATIHESSMETDTSLPEPDSHMTEDKVCSLQVQ